MFSSAGICQYHYDAILGCLLGFSYFTLMMISESYPFILYLVSDCIANYVLVVYELYDLLLLSLLFLNNNNTERTNSCCCSSVLNIELFNLIIQCISEELSFLRILVFRKQAQYITTCMYILIVYV